MKKKNNKTIKKKIDLFAEQLIARFIKQQTIIVYRVNYICKCPAYNNYSAKKIHRMMGQN